MFMFLISIQNVDSTWDAYAERIAKIILQKGGKDAIYDLRFLEDSTGRYMIFYERFVYTMPSGYKVFYKTPYAIKLPKDAPNNIDQLIISRVQKEQFGIENLLEVASIGFGCGLVTIGALIAVIVGISR